MSDRLEFGPTKSELTDFAHASEREFARLLDFYAIEWEYEPRAFAVEWDDHGTPVKWFRPDFHLPEEDLYIEITTMNQKLVTKKNRKVRQMRHLYPDVKCKIFYQRDYLNLLVKYGLQDAAEDEEGLVAPTRMPGPPEVVNLAEQDEAAAG